MNLQISFRHMESSPNLRSTIEEKCERFSKYFHGNFSMTWTLETDRHACVVHCHMVGNHMDYFAEARTEAFLDSIDQVVAKVEKQLRKHKEVVKHAHPVKNRAA